MNQETETEKVVRNFDCLVETEGLLKVTGSHVHCRSGYLSRKQYKIKTRHKMDYQIAPFPTTLSDSQGHSPVATCNLSNKISKDTGRQAVPLDN